MGQEIGRSSFSADDHAAFRARLRHETAHLKRWFDERAFVHAETPTTGLEMEAWLIDRDQQPAPENAAFVAAANDPNVVFELSKFNFELNADPQPLEGAFLARMEADLAATWDQCRRTAQRMGLGVAAVGILPTVRDENLQPAWMSDSERYRALNGEMTRLRAGAPLHIDIAGRDRLEYRCDHIMLEAACTSLQGHLQVNQEEAARAYNASLAAAAPLVALAANAPFLYGKSLWAETRVPAFEQATALHGFSDVEGRQVLRVTLGTGYVRHSLLEPFVENLSYPALLPVLSEDGATLPHLRLHNGTIWRWVRPIVGFTGGAPHLRLEHRVMPAGPTLADSIANLAALFGLTLALASAATPIEDEISFEEARANFYACARDGLEAQIVWRGRSVPVRALLAQTLLPLAKQELERRGADRASLALYFDEVLAPRVRTGQTGTAWQRAAMAASGGDAQEMLARYVALQTAGEPVAFWPV